MVECTSIVSTKRKIESEDDFVVVHFCLPSQHSFFSIVRAALRGISVVCRFFFFYVALDCRPSILDISPPMLHSMNSPARKDPSRTW